MSGRSQYMRDYYKTHKEAILEQRKRRYDNDPAYRAKQNEMRRKSRLKKRLFDHKEDLSDSKPKGKAMKVAVKGRHLIVKMFTVAEFCRYNGVTRARVGKWHQAGWLTKPSYTNSQGHYLLTEYEFEGLSKLLRSHRMSLAGKGYKFKADDSFKAKVGEYYKGLHKGVPHSVIEEDDNV